MLLGEEFLVDVVGQPHVEQPVLLLNDERFLPSQFRPLRTAIRLDIAGLGRQHHSEPVADGFVLHLHLVDEDQHLGLDVRFADADTRVILPGLIGAAEVDVVVNAAVLPPRPDQLAGDGMTAMATGHELPRVRQRRGMVDMPTQQGLHPIPGRPVDQRLMLAAIPFPLVFQFAEIGPVLRDVVDRTAGKLRLRLPPQPPFGVDLLDQPIKRQVFIGLEVEDAFDVGGRFGIDFDDFTDIDLLLFGIEAEIAARTAYEPSKVSSEDAQRQLAEQAAAGALTIGDVSNAVLNRAGMSKAAPSRDTPGVCRRERLEGDRYGPSEGLVRRDRAGVTACPGGSPSPDQQRDEAVLATDVASPYPTMGIDQRETAKRKSSVSFGLTFVSLHGIIVSWNEKMSS